VVHVYKSITVAVHVFVSMEMVAMDSDLVAMVTMYRNDLSDFLYF
jgi:hypothetical protein